MLANEALTNYHRVLFVFLMVEIQPEFLREVYFPIRYEKVNDDRIRFYIPEDLGPLNELKDREQSGKLRPNGSDSSQLPRQDWAYELQLKFE